jgi:hypothetical protein
VVVKFATAPGSGGLVLDAAAACPPQVLSVYCNGAELAGGAAGFELLTGSSTADGKEEALGWRPARAVQLLSNDTILLNNGPGLTPPKRVRYAYADWPVTSIRNGASGHSLPARVFDVAVDTNRAAPSPPRVPILYPQTGATVDPRLTASISLGGKHGSGVVIAAEHPLEVEDAPPLPQTRDPGYGRPPFTSSRLRMQSPSGVQIVLTCKDDPRQAADGCSFGDTAVLRGVGVDIIPTRPSAKRLAFTLAPPRHGQLAAHYYLQVNITNAADAATPPHWGSRSFARGNLFYFWIDNAPAEVPSSVGPLRENASRVGIVPGSQSLQTAAISKALQELAAGWRLFFEAAAITRTSSLTVTGRQAMELGHGAILQYGDEKRLAVSGAERSSISTSLSVSKPPPPPGSCGEAAFITITSGHSAGGGAYLGEHSSCSGSIRCVSH